MRQRARRTYSHHHHHHHRVGLGRVRLDATDSRGGTLHRSLTTRVRPMLDWHHFPPPAPQAAIKRQKERQKEREKKENNNNERKKRKKKKKERKRGGCAGHTHRPASPNLQGFEFLNKAWSTLCARSFGRSRLGRAIEL